MWHCVPEATLKATHFRSCLKLFQVMSSSRKCTGKLFQTRGPAAAKFLSPNVDCKLQTADSIKSNER